MVTCHLPVCMQVARKHILHTQTVGFDSNHLPIENKPHKVHCSTGNVPYYPKEAPAKPAITCKMYRTRCIFPTHETIRLASIKPATIMQVQNCPTSCGGHHGLVRKKQAHSNPPFRTATFGYRPQLVQLRVVTSRTLKICFRL